MTAKDVTAKDPGIRISFSEEHQQGAKIKVIAWAAGDAMPSTA